MLTDSGWEFGIEMGYNKVVVTATPPRAEDPGEMGIFLKGLSETFLASNDRNIIRILVGPKIHLGT